MTKLLSISALLFVAACQDATAPSALKPSLRQDKAVSETTQDFPMSFVACNGEPVTFLGTLRISQNVNGGGQATVIDYHGSGDGDITGAHYVGNMKEVDKQSGNSTTFILRLQVSGGGGKPFVVEIFNHYALAPDGLPGAVIERTKTGCD